MKTTAIAPANIAFIKYWGKKDEALRLPANPSVSMNLSEAYTVTTVDFSEQYRDEVYFLPPVALTFYPRPLKKSQLGKWRMRLDEEMRVIAHLDRLRKLAKKNEKAMVVTGNSFPASSGMASSASGFAALTVAGAAALDLTLSEKELSIVARLGSGSACRSIPDGFVEWVEGETSEASYAHSLYVVGYWDIRDILVIIERKNKKISSTAGMKQASTSPFFQARLAAIPERISRIKKALKNKDMSLLGSVLEEDCLDMHQVMQTQIPPLYYWSDTTKTIMDAVGNWRKDGLPVYFTIDAGPNIHLICEAKDEQAVVERIKTLNYIDQVLINKPAHGAHIIDNHLF